MSGGSLAHSRISSNTLRALETRWQAIRAMSTIQTQACAWQNHAIPTLTYQYHTIRATSQRPNSYTSRFLVLWFEVLSDSTEGKDRIRKANLYHTCPTIQEYVLIATKYQAVEVTAPISAMNGRSIYLDQVMKLSLRVWSIRFPLSILYRGTAVPEMLNGQDEICPEPEQDKLHTLFCRI